MDSNQGGESRDLSRLFYTCIRIEQERKLFIISLINDEFLRGKVQMLRAVVLSASLNKVFLTFLKVVCSVHENGTYVMACFKSDEVLAFLPHDMNILE